MASTISITHLSCLLVVTYGWIKIDEDRARNVFAIARLSEEGFVGAGLANVFRIRIGTTVGLETVLEEVAVGLCVRLDVHLMLLVLVVGVDRGMAVKKGGEENLTAPRHCYQAACQLGQCGGGRPRREGFCQSHSIQGTIRPKQMGLQCRGNALRSHC